MTLSPAVGFVLGTACKGSTVRSPQSRSAATLAFVVLEIRFMGLIESLMRDADRIAQVGEVAIDDARAAGVPCYYIDESLDPEGRIIRHDPDGTRHVLAEGDEDIKTFPPE